ncbi:hypothetical protein CSUI_007655 [Cystoisospora suis]|uniref:Uncharacterized protein n=1 Tax=Cystoisospora suis TaxID=483139 RepID=A0A2C6JTK8_9APIC|nr:hypothetical protein CSUI_007655 [Cystoisospora suis]
MTTVCFLGLTDTFPKTSRTISHVITVQCIHNHQTGEGHGTQAQNKSLGEHADSRRLTPRQRHRVTFPPSPGVTSQDRVQTVSAFLSQFDTRYLRDCYSVLFPFS